MTRIHITGASGSGTTTLGRAVSQHLGLQHLDTDDYFWAPTNPPYACPRPVDERVRFLAADFGATQQWVLSGSLGDWAQPIFHLFELVVFLYVSADIRLARLRHREAARFGLEAITPGGKMYQKHMKFIEWASQYDEGDESVRSLRFHEQWLARLKCPVLRLQGEICTSRQVEQIVTCSKHAKERSPTLA